jgi:hypothetical protein
MANLVQYHLLLMQSLTSINILQGCHDAHEKKNISPPDVNNSIHLGKTMAAVSIGSSSYHTEE